MKNYSISLGNGLPAKPILSPLETELSYDSNNCILELLFDSTTLTEDNLSILSDLSSFKSRWEVSNTHLDYWFCINEFYIYITELPKILEQFRSTNSLYLVMKYDNQIILKSRL